MAIIKSGVTTDLLTIDATSKAARVTPYSSAGVEQVLATAAKQDIGNASLAALASGIASGAAPTDGVKSTYSATVLNLVTAASATNIFTIQGSGTKTIRIIRILVSGIQTTSGNMSVILRKQSTADSGGTSTSPTAVPHDSASTAATASIFAYTANPTMGGLVGTVISKRLTFPSAATAFDPPADVFTADLPGQALVLRGAAQGLAVSFNGVTLTGGSVNVTMTWTEE